MFAAIALAAIAFDIEAGNAAARLNQWAKRAQFHVLANFEHTGTLQTNAVRGSYTPLQALNLMLADTGFTYTMATPTFVSVFFVGPDIVVPPAHQPDIRVPCWCLRSRNTGASMKRTPVASSNIRSVGYENGEMQIEFISGRVYKITGPGVEDEYKALMAADSKGKYFAAHIRPNKNLSQVLMADEPTTKPAEKPATE